MMLSKTILAQAPAKTCHLQPLIFQAVLMARSSLADLNDERRRLDLRIRAASKAVLRHRYHGATEHQRSVALRAFVLSGYDMAKAIAVAKHVAGKGHGADAVDQRTWEMIIEEAFMNTAVDELAVMGSWGAHPGIQSARTAERLLRECHLAHWVRETNIIKGVAPRTAVVLDRLSRSVAGEGFHANVPLSVCPVVSGAGRKWMWRWRHRWGGRVAKLRVRDPIPQAEIAEKAFRFTQTCVRQNEKSEPFCGPETGPTF